MTSFVFTLVHSIFPGNVNSPIDYSSRNSFGHFCCRLKQGKRLSEFLQKYTDSGTETTHLAGYNILVLIYVKISAGLPLLFIGAIRERSSKIRYCIIWRCLHLKFSITNVSEKWNMQGFERMLSYEQYPEEKSRLWLSPLKKLINLHGRGSRFPPFFFFWLFLLQKAEICWHQWKTSISRLLWSDRWKLHGEIQRHAIVITYMFMTNDRCEDSFV